MKQTISLTPTSSALNLEAWIAGSPVVLAGAVPAFPSMSAWQMQLWKYPHNASLAGATPLATAVGTVTSGTLILTFSPSQMSYQNLDLTNVANNNNYWLTLGGTDTDGFAQIIRAGCVEIMPSAFVSNAPTTAIAITVANDVATFVFNGATYTLPVQEIVAPDQAVEGEIIVLNDMAVLTVNNVSYTFPVQEST